MNETKLTFDAPSWEYIEDFEDSYFVIEVYKLELDQIIQLISLIENVLGSSRKT